MYWQAWNTSCEPLYHSLQFAAGLHFPGAVLGFGAFAVSVYLRKRTQLIFKFFHVILTTIALLSFFAWVLFGQFLKMGREPTDTINISYFEHFAVVLLGSTWIVTAIEDEIEDRASHAEENEADAESLEDV